MSGLFDLISTLFWLGFWVVLILGVIAVFYYNKLRRFKESVNQSRANVGAAVKRMADVMNRAVEAVKGYQGFEQFTQVKISQDATAATLVSAYHQTSNMMAALQGAAQRFPELQTSSIYRELMSDSRTCHADIMARNQALNQAISSYNTERGSIPAVFIAGFLGFRREEYLQFDTQGLETEVAAVQQLGFKDDERMEQLLQGAGSTLLGAGRALAVGAGQAGKLIATGAGQASKLVAEKMKDTAAVSPKYFYMPPGGVPKGPASREDLRVLLQQGMIASSHLVAEVGSQDWKTIEAVSTEWEHS